MTATSSDLIEVEQDWRKRALAAEAELVELRWDWLEEYESARRLSIALKHEKVRTTTLQQALNRTLTNEDAL